MFCTTQLIVLVSLVYTEEWSLSENEENEDDEDDCEDENEEVEDEEEEDYDEEEDEEEIPGGRFFRNLSDMIDDANLRLSGSSSTPETIEAPTRRVRTNFDRTLPARHEYLGTDLEELRGRTLFDENSVVSLPILMELNVVLIPGQTLPFAAFYRPTIAMFRKIIAKDKTFGVISASSVSPYGTTAEIFQYQEDNEYKFQIKAKGRQRFKLLEEKPHTHGISYLKVLILPEISLLRPLFPRFTSLDKYRNNHSAREKLSSYDAASTQWPSWVYKQYDTNVLVERVMKGLKNLKSGMSLSTVPSNPVDLSYWVAQCLPIDGKHRIKMLSFNTSIERLQYALRLLSKGQKLYCSRCGNSIANRKDVFSMSIDGPQGMYCNPGGYVHEIITVYNGTGMSLLNDSPSLDHTWFPGYGWTIAQCSNCDCHMGWLFTAMKMNLKPVKFWGLTRKSISTRRKVYQ